MSKMILIDEATVKLALEALDRHQSIVGLTNNKQDVEAIIALRKTLTEQPAQQQEPEIVQRVKRRTGKTIRTARNPNITARECIELADWIAANTSPPAQRTCVGLTDVEWMNIVNKDQAWFGQRPDEVAHEVAKLVEAKLKEKNA